MKPFSKIEPDKVIEAVPVVTAMQTAAINAKQIRCFSVGVLYHQLRYRHSHHAFA